MYDVYSVLTLESSLPGKCKIEPSIKKTRNLVLGF